jgi:hypothetical protein
MNGVWNISRKHAKAPIEKRKRNINDPQGLNRRELSGCLLTLGLTGPSIVIAGMRPTAAAPAGGTAPNIPRRDLRVFEALTALPQRIY